MTNRKFWIPKIDRNMQRDIEVNTTLKELGYTVFRFWQKEVDMNLEECLNSVIQHLKICTID